MKTRHAEVHFPFVKNPWIDGLSAALLACHKAEDFGISHEWIGAENARRGERHGMSIETATGLS
jgi:hypothetical protein